MKSGQFVGNKQDFEKMVLKSEPPVIAIFGREVSDRHNLLLLMMERFSDVYENDLVLVEIPEFSADDILEKYNLSKDKIIDDPTTIFFNKGQETGRTTIPDYVVIEDLVKANK